MDTESYDPPPRYEVLPGLSDVAMATDDGRVNINLDSKLCRRLSVLIPRENFGTSQQPEQHVPSAQLEYRKANIRLNIVIQVVGSRGDVQPFTALANELQRHGHRVRLATHGQFGDFVRKSGLEFFSIGGDPAELMAYMVKNPGLIPNIKTLRRGEIQRKRKMVAEMLEGCWRSCIEPDPVTGAHFVADAIIANPPSFAHIHCAQALGIPVHLMFTMPWTSTREFCHPLANLHRNDSDMSASVANYASYMVVEWMTWQGLGDIVNKWRESLDLEAVPLSEGPLLAETLKIPFTYCWSPGLVPKPADWPENIDVCGFFFRDPPVYEPESELDTFLRAGPPPVYIGFGSIVIDEPEQLTDTILESVRASGVRAIISRGWSKLGANQASHDQVLYIDDCPHEWLFQHVAAVVHHGGAGTTACGLLNGRPTTIVPFFGDQPFWGSMVHAGGAGPAPIPFKQLNKNNLTAAIKFCLTTEATSAAGRIAEKMRTETGVERAVASFHAHLPMDEMLCDILKDRAAAFHYSDKGKDVKISAEAAEALLRNSRLKGNKLHIHKSNPFTIENRRWDPLTAAASSLASTGLDMVTSATDILATPIKAMRTSNADDTAKMSSSSHTYPDSSHEEIYGRPAALTLPPAQKPGPSKESNRAMAAIAGSAAGVGGILKHYSKGMLLDLPYAVTEGMRNAPSLYGGEVYNPGQITDWKSGSVAAGKNFAHGIVEGIGGIVTQPMRGAEKEGALGAAKGVGIGLLNLTTKFSSGAIGLVALPGQGLYKSARALVKRNTRNTIIQARWAEAEYNAHTARDRRHEYDLNILERFDAFR